LAVMFCNTRHDRRPDRAARRIILPGWHAEDTKAIAVTSYPLLQRLRTYMIHMQFIQIARPCLTS
jgi:hypothetical protein